MTSDLKLKIVAILTSATSLRENRVYDLADSILSALPETTSPAPAPTSDSRKVRLAFENIRGGYVGWKDNPNFAVLGAAIAGAPCPVPQKDSSTPQQDGALQVLQQVRTCLQTINDGRTGTITDTLWFSSHETLFEFIDNALAAAPPEPYGWLQFIDGMKTQNFARTQEELENVQNMFRLMKHPGKAEYIPVFRNPPATPVLSAEEIDAIKHAIFVLTPQSHDYVPAAAVKHLSALLAKNPKSN